MERIHMMTCLKHVPNLNYMERIKRNSVILKFPFEKVLNERFGEGWWMRWGDQIDRQQVHNTIKRPPSESAAIVIS